MWMSSCQCRGTAELMGVKYRQADVAGAAAKGSILFRRRCQLHAEGAVASGLEGAGASSSRVQVPLEGADERVRAALLASS